MSLKIDIEGSWKNVLSHEFKQVYFTDLVKKVKGEYRTHLCHPNGKDIFSAFNLCPFDKTKAVIIGQDPYHGPNQAHGLCFSVNLGVPLPPSLKNIFQEIHSDLNIYRNDGDLSNWAKQGVLLLNSVLTVRDGAPGSHKYLNWEQFTNQVIKLLSSLKEHLVFLLWGSYAIQKKNIIDKEKHLVLESGHPSPLSANRGFWFGNRHFSKTNNYLIEKGVQPIKW